MITITSAAATSSAPPSAFFALWGDMATWPEWNSDTEWVRLEGPFVEGATGRLKPKGGPAVRFVVTRLVRDREFVDVSRLVGARLTFAHTVEEIAGRTAISVVVTLTGPLARLWNLILGKGIHASAQRDLDGLVLAAEAAAGSDAAA